MSKLKDLAVAVTYAVGVTAFCSGLFGLGLFVIRFAWRLAG